MNAKDFLLTDPKIHEAVSNGYDIRLEEHEWIEKMELYALTKQGSINTNVVRPASASASDGELLATEAQAQGMRAIKVKTGTVIFCEGEQFLFGLNRKTGKPECFNLYGMSGISDEEALPLSGG